jgi:hypothetical protein
MNKTIASFGLRAVMSASAMALTLAATSGIAHAQVTTSAVNGVVIDNNGAGISNANILLLNTSTGLSRTVSTDSSGNFAVRSLPVTGLYSVTVTANGYQGERVDDIGLTLGGTTNLSFSLDQGSAEDTVVAVAQRMVMADVAIGPSASFGLDTLENAPAINRNITDVIRLDPRIFVDESRGGINSVQCVGQNPRFNSTTLDGIQVNDSFGLNSNGYPTERQPFPFDALEQVSVEIAPFDVVYGGFTACNINAVTKTGTNEFHGSAFIDYTDDSLRGDTAGNTDFDFGEFDEIRYGASVGGPIIKDKLFFYAAYEKLEGVNVFGPTEGLDQNTINQIADISRNLYQYDPGTTPSNFGNADEKILVKLDWDINSQHRASATFNYNDGFNIVRSDGDPDEFEFTNHLYERGAELISYSGAVYSDWSDKFSTELRASYLELDNRQESLGGTDFGEVQINTGDFTVYLGSDDSRGANDLNYDRLALSGRATYTAGNHEFSGGIDYENLEIFNLFVQQAQTEIRFNSVADFAAGRASQVEFNGAVSGDINDAAAEWGYSTMALYGQDEWSVNDALTVIAGLRYDVYSSDDVPTENPTFVAEYGFSNSQNLDGKDLIQPRLGFTYDATDALQLRGGIGRFSGGNPNVWVSNAYSGSNVTQVGARIRGDIDLFSLDYVFAEEGVPNAPGYAVPSELAASVATGQGRNFELNYVDPDFKIPSNWKYSLGATFTPDFDLGKNLFSGPWMFTADVLFLEEDDTAIILRGDLVEDGTFSRTVTSGGQDFDFTVTDYASPNLDSFVLTNSDIGNRALAVSLGLAKEWDSGWGLTLGYTYTDAEDVQPMTSAVAFSNYNNRAFTDPQEQILSRSNYSIEHRFTSSLSYKKDFFGDYETGFFGFFQHQTGAPFTRSLRGASNRLYNFTPFIGNGNAIPEPGFERNGQTAPGWTKIDLKITQDLPGFRADDRAQVFMVVDNLTNLINSDWGVLQTAGFPGTLPVGTPFSTNTASAYEIRFGAKYDF